MCMQKKTDQELVSAYLSGDSISIEHLITRHKDKVFGFILSKVKDVDLANDIFQDVFIKVINKLQEGKYSEEGKFIAWLMRLAHNMVIDYFRKMSRHRMVRSQDNYDVFGFLKEEQHDDEVIAIESHIHLNLKTLIAHLSQEQREVLEMRYYADMTFKEIAEECGISINTALGRMRYALINLRKLQEKYQVSLSVK